MTKKKGFWIIGVAVAAVLLIGGVWVWQAQDGAAESAGLLFVNIALLSKGAKLNSLLAGGELG